MDPLFTGIIVLAIEEPEGLAEDYSQRVLVSGSGPLPYASLFLARFDAEPIEAIAVDMHGTGFTGYLKSRPAEGARLFVEFEGEDPIDTGLVYSSTTGPNA
jgi:hypothetical protein